MIIRLLAAAVLAQPASPAPAAECTATGRHDPASLRYICDGARGWAESVATGDTAVLERILAEDFVGVDPKGKQYPKDVMVRNTKTAPQHFKSNQINDVAVRFYGNMAVAQGSETWERQTGEKGRFVWTDTWLKRRGKWEIVAAQDVIATVDPAK